MSLFYDNTLLLELLELKSTINLSRKFRPQEDVEIGTFKFQNLEWNITCICLTITFIISLYESRLEYLIRMKNYCSILPDKSSLTFIKTEIFLNKEC